MIMCIVVDWSMDSQPDIRNWAQLVANVQRLLSYFRLLYFIVKTKQSNRKSHCKQPQEDVFIANF